MFIFVCLLVLLACVCSPFSVSILTAAQEHISLKLPAHQKRGILFFLSRDTQREASEVKSIYSHFVDLDPVSILESNYDWTKLWCKKCVVWTKIWPQVHPWIQEQSQFPSIQMNRRVGKRGLPKTKSGPQGVWSDQGPLVIMSRVWTPRKEWQFLLLKILMERKYLVDKYRFSFKHVG